MDQHEQHRMHAHLAALVDAGLHLAIGRVDPDRLAGLEPVRLDQDLRRRGTLLGAGRRREGQEQREKRKPNHDPPPQEITGRGKG